MNDRIIPLPGTVIHPQEYPKDPPSPLRDGRPLTYLACPYTHPNPNVREMRYEFCTRAAAWLIQNKHWNVFSPITHSHPLHTIGGCASDWATWERIDREYLSVSRRLVVLCLSGWSKSVGVQAEIDIARAQGITLLFLKPDVINETWTFVDSFHAEDNPEPEQQPPQTAERSKVPEGMDNPKDLIGLTKPPLRLVPAVGLLRMAKVMELGARKYGPYNWREKAVRYTVYLEAAMRHLVSALDGEEIDPESKQPHTAHAAACMAIILDAQSLGKLIDDRPSPGAAAKVIKEMTEKTK